MLCGLTIAMAMAAFSLGIFGVLSSNLIDSVFLFEGRLIDAVVGTHSGG